MNKVLVIGHSFVRRADKHYQLGLEGIKPNLGLIDAVITFRGWSGLTAQKLEDKSCVVDNLDPDILVIDIGSNDLANGADPVLLARDPVIVAPLQRIKRDIHLYQHSDGVHLSSRKHPKATQSGIFKYLLSIKTAVVRGLRLCN